MVKQGDIILISFNPSVGHEEAKYRPALIVSNDDYNSFCGGMYLVCPISHTKDFPLHINLPEGMKTSGKVLCEHIRAMDIVERGYKCIESVPTEFMQEISEVLRACVDVNVKASDV